MQRWRPWLRRAMVCLLLGLSMLPASACRALPAAPPRAPPMPDPAFAMVRFETVDCRFEPPARHDVACGDLIVPEDYTRPFASQIRLHVAIVRSTGDPPESDPVIYLQGGPGAHALTYLSRIIHRFRGVLVTRDLIVFDQRGVGYSRPSLDCPELDDLAVRVVREDLDYVAEMAADLAAVDACRARLTAEGIDLHAYTTTAVANDTRALVHALGLERWNLYGVSFGTRPALMILQREPVGLRTAVLDSTCPLDIDISSDMLACYSHALALLVQTCRADLDCHTAHPDLEAELFERVAEVTARPLSVPVRLSRPTSNGWYASQTVDGRVLLRVVFGMLRSASMMRQIPALLDELEAGETTMLAALLTPTVQPFTVSEGMNLSVTCQDTCIGSQLAQTMKINGVPESVQTLALDDMSERLARCQVWLGGLPSHHTAVAFSSRVPTLLLTGELDTLALPAWSAALAETMPNATMLSVAGVGHGVVASSACGRTAVGTFIADAALPTEFACEMVR